MEPGLAILIAGVLGILGSILFPRLGVGFVLPRGRVSVDSYYRWVAGLLAGYVLFLYLLNALMPSRLEVEPCRSMPDPLGAWIYVYTGVIALWGIVLVVLALRVRDRIDWCLDCEVSERE